MKHICKVLSLVLVFGMLISACACSGGNSAAAAPAAAPEEAPAAAPEGAPAGAPEEAPAAAPAGGAEQPSGEQPAAAAANNAVFVYTPYWGEDNVKTAVGGEILFFGDIHDLEDNYFYYDADTGETRGVFTYLKQNDKHPGLYASIGDYLQASSDITTGADVYNRCIDRIRA